MTRNPYRRNLVFSWVSILFNMVVIFFLTPYLIKELGELKYGIWIVINSIVGYMSLAEAGVNITTGRFVNFHIGENDLGSASKIISTSTAFYVLLPIAAMPVIWISCSVLFDLNNSNQNIFNDDTFFAIITTAAALFLNLLSSNTKIKLSVNLRFDIIALISIVEVTVRSLFIIYFLSYFAENTLLQISLATLASALSGLILSIFLSRIFGYDIPVTWVNVNRYSLRKIYSFSVWVLISNLGVMSISNTDNIIIAYYIGIEDVAIYATAFMLFTHLGTLLSKVNQIKIPTVTQALGARDRVKLNNEITGLRRLTGVLATPAIACFVVLVDPFIKLWLGDGFQRAILLSQVMAVALIMDISMQGIGAALWSKGIVKLLGLLKIGIAILNILISIYFMSFFDNKLLGIALATTVCRLLETSVIFPVLASRFLGISSLSINKANIAVLGCFVLLFVGFEVLGQVLTINSWLSFFAASLVFYSLGLVFCYFYFEKFNQRISST